MLYNNTENNLQIRAKKGIHKYLQHIHYKDKNRNNNNNNNNNNNKNSNSK